MEIEDILMRNEQLVLENEALRQQIQDIKNGLEGSCYACESVGKMNKKLREERDEARRLYLASTFSENEIIPEMKSMGWDCFGEHQ